MPCTLRHTQHSVTPSPYPCKWLYPYGGDKFLKPKAIKNFAGVGAQLNTTRGVSADAVAEEWCVVAIPRKHSCRKSRLPSSKAFAALTTCACVARLFLALLIMSWRDMLKADVWGCLKCRGCPCYDYAHGQIHMVIKSAGERFTLRFAQHIEDSRLH